MFIGSSSINYFSNTIYDNTRCWRIRSESWSYFCRVWEKKTLSVIPFNFVCTSNEWIFSWGVDIFFCLGRTHTMYKAFFCLSLPWMTGTKRIPVGAPSLHCLSAGADRLTRMIVRTGPGETLTDCQQTRLVFGGLFRWFQLFWGPTLQVQVLCKFWNGFFVKREIISRWVLVVSHAF